MEKNTNTIDAKSIVIRFAGDSGDGMQLTGTIFSNVSAILGNEIATFPDYPAEIRAPQGTLDGVSGFQVRFGAGVYNSGGTVDVLVAMNPAALKVNKDRLRKDSIIITDIDSFGKRDLEKALFKTEDPFVELGIEGLRLIEVPITSMTRESLSGYDLDAKSQLRSKNMFALGVVCWLFDRSLDEANHQLSNKFKRKPLIEEANLKVLADGYNFAHNQHMPLAQYKVETADTASGTYLDVSGNMATAYGFVAASEKSKKPLFLGSYPITPATDILHELSKLKQLGVKVVQAEDEIAAICMSIGASFAGDFAITTTSGPGLALKAEALGLAVMAELPLVVVDVQRGGPSTGLPTKSEQTDLRQALYGRSGESPAVVMAASTPTDCFDMAYWASKIAMEHITPVILLTDGYIANGASAWRIPDLDKYPAIVPHDQTQFKGKEWTAMTRDPKTFARYWAGVGTEGFMHRLGGLEKNSETGAISVDPVNHKNMINLRQAKIDAIAQAIPDLEIIGSKDSDLLVVGWGGTYGHIKEAVEKMNNDGLKIAYAHFNFIHPFPENTEEVLLKYKKVLVAEQNTGHLADLLVSKIDGLHVIRYNELEARPFSVRKLIEVFTNALKN